MGSLLSFLFLITQQDFLNGSLTSCLILIMKNDFLKGSLMSFLLLIKKKDFRKGTLLTKYLGCPSLFLLKRRIVFWFSFFVLATTMDVLNGSLISLAFLTKSRMSLRAP